MLYRVPGDPKTGYDLGVGTGMYGGYVPWVRSAGCVGSVRGYGPWVRRTGTVYPRTVPVPYPYPKARTYIPYPYPKARTYVPYRT